MDDKTFRTLSVIYLATLAVAVISMFAVFYLHYENTQLKSDIVMIVKDVADRQKQIDELNATVQEYQGYKFANEALLQHCDPDSVVNAIKITPLPKRG
jgi:cell division protein FtsL